jgi:hypothetical protein
MAPPHPAPQHSPVPNAQPSGPGQAGTGQAGTGQAQAEPPAAEPAVATATVPVPEQPPAGPLPPPEIPTQQRAIAGLFLGLLSLFGLLGLSNLQRGIYIAAFTLAAGALALWLSITSISRARRGGTTSPRGSVTAIVIGAVGVLLSGALLIGLAAFGRQAAAYSRCLSGANTIAAQQACQSQFVHAVKRRAAGG